MKKCSIVLMALLFFIAATPLWAGVIRGRILDDKKQPVEFANIAIYLQGETVPVKGTVADEKGQFIIEGIKNGEYTVRISYIGYQQQERKASLTAANDDCNLRTITLAEDSEVLKEVNVTAQKAAMRLEVDKKVFDVASQITSVGLSASEALENIPSVEVDQEGNISLRGSSSVTVWINGKAQGLTSDNRGDILQQMPAESIERIEVITNPSSKYSSEGSAGIINIILKRDRKPGYYGGVQLNVAKQQRVDDLGGRVGANINYSSGVMEAYANVGLGRRVHQGGGLSEREYVDADPSSPTFGQKYGFLNQNNENDNKGSNMFLRGGLTWHFTSKDEIGVSYMGMVDLGKNKNVSDYHYEQGAYAGFEDLFTNAGYKTYERDRVSTSSHKPKMNNATLSYRHEWKTNHTLDAIVSWGQWMGENTIGYDQDTRYTTLGTSDRTVQEQQGKMGNSHWDIQMDYVQPIDDRSKFEAGYKATISHENSPNETWNSYNGSPMETIPTLYNRFIYDQNLHALYANYQNKIGEKFGYQLGLRAEYWKVETESHDYDMEHGTSLLPAGYEHPKPFSKSFFKVFPSLFLSYQLPHEQELQFNFTRRLARPWGGQMNSFKNISDSTSISFGYPELTPSYSSSMELNYLKTWEEHTVSVSAYFRPSTDVIQNISYMDKGVRYSTQRNLAKEQSSGIELIGKNKVFKIVSLTTTINGYYYKLEGGEFDILDQGAYHKVNVRSTDDFSWNASEMMQIMLPASISFQATGRYNAARVFAQGKRKGSYGLDLGLRKSFFDRKLNVSFNARNVLDSRRDKSNTEAPGYMQYSESWRGGRRFMLQLSYSFGNMMPKRGNRRSDDGGEQRDYNGESPEDF